MTGRNSSGRGSSRLRDEERAEPDKTTAERRPTALRSDAARGQTRRRLVASPSGSDRPAGVDEFRLEVATPRGVTGGARGGVRFGVERARPGATTAEWRPTVLRSGAARAETGGPLVASLSGSDRPAGGDEFRLEVATQWGVTGEARSGVRFCVGRARPGATTAEWRPTLTRGGAAGADKAVAAAGAPESGGGFDGRRLEEAAEAPSGSHRAWCGATSAEWSASQRQEEEAPGAGAASERRRRARGGRTQRCGALGARGGRRTRPTRPGFGRSGGSEAQLKPAARGSGPAGSQPGSQPPTAETWEVSRDDDAEEEPARCGEGACATGAAGEAKEHRRGERGRGRRGGRGLGRPKRRTLAEAAPDGRGGAQAAAIPCGLGDAEAPSTGVHDAGVAEEERERSAQRPEEGGRAGADPRVPGEKPGRRVAEAAGALRRGGAAGKASGEAPVFPVPPAAGQAAATAGLGRARGPARIGRDGGARSAGRVAPAQERPQRAAGGPSTPAEAMREASELAGAGSCSLPRFLQTWRGREATRTTQHDRAKDRVDAQCGGPREARRRGRTANLHPGGVGKPKGIFPVAPPRREAVRALMAKRVSAEAVETGVDLVMDALGAACWVACGSTPSVPKHLRAADSPAMESVIAMAVETTGRFMSEAMSAGHALETGRAGPELAQALRALEKACREMGRDYAGAVARGESRGIKLDPDRLSLPQPEVTGRLNIEGYLSEPLRRAYVDPASLVRLPREDLPPSRIGRFTSAWGDLLTRLDGSGILRLAPAEDTYRGPLGEDLRAEVFAVRKDEESDRSILNRQRRNAIEERVDGVTATFPHGSQIAEITLEDNERLRVSADDLPDFYHTLGVSQERALSNVFGPWLSAEQARARCPRAWAALAEEARERAEETDCVASLWGALPMGDGNAVSFSQEAHANILSAGGCMRPEDLLVYLRPPPVGDVAEGLMVDDHVVLGRVPRDAKRGDALAALERLQGADDATVQEAGGDVGVLARSHRAYARAGLGPKESKAVRFADRADVWGASVDGDVGVVRAKNAVLWRAYYVSIAVLRVKRTTVSLFRAVLGLWTHVMTFCRPGFALLSRSFAWLREWDTPVTAYGQREIRRVPGAVQDELRLLLVFAPHFERDLRGGFAPILACTDASSSLAASVTATVDRNTLEALWVHRVQRRGYVRMVDALESSLVCAEDDGDLHTARVLARVLGRGEGQRAKGEAICPWVEELVDGMQWQAASCFRTRRSQHINVSEASALVAEIDREAADPALHRTKGIVCLDSDVVVGAGSKGRSSSRELNRPLRRGAPTLLLTRMQRGYVHVRSDFNPADDPTRRRAVRGPRTAPPPWAESVREEGVRALETAYPALGARRGPARGVFRTPDDEAPPA